MKFVLTIFITSFFLSAFGQLTDTFSDGDFTNNPSWNGTNSVYIINASNELQLNNSAPGTSYLSAPHLLSDLDNKEWKFLIKQPFAPSSSNFGRIYLTSTDADLSTNPDGFYLQFGESGSIDAVRLFKSVGGVNTQICATPDGGISSSVNAGIRVVRNASGTWNLGVDFTGGTNYSTNVTGLDPTLILGTHFGYLNVYTLSNATKFYLDDVYVGDEILDLIAPQIISANFVSSTEVDLLFSESLNPLSANAASNYVLSPSLSVTTAMLDGTNNALVHLTVASSFVNGTIYSITANNITDLAGNSASGLNTSLTYLIGENALKGDLIINEFFCDPSPSYGLKSGEFVEIFNKSTKYIDLTGWKLGDGASFGTVVSGFISPNEYVVLCPSTYVDSFPNTRAVTSFPSLNNSGDQIILQNNTLLSIDEIAYTDDWYQDEIKKDGGYTLELINPNDPCSDAQNWRASVASIGGTPGALNSILNSTPDAQIPSLISESALAPNFLELVFSEGMDSTSIVNTSLTCLPSLSVQSIFVSQNGSNTAIVTFNENFVSSQLYTYNLAAISDCWLNITNVSGVFALSENPVEGDLIINEFLFDPITGAYDFVELYNNSSKVLNLKDFSLSNWDNDTIGNTKVFTENFTLFPNEYVVISPDSTSVKSNYNAVSGRFYPNELPSLDNDSSSIILAYQNIVLDRVSYSADWHFSLIDDTENKTLEKISPSFTSNDKDNWHTAAESVGFGTPGKVNSQFQSVLPNGVFSVNSATFSPDNDGLEDVMVFSYEMITYDNVGKLDIFDDQGRKIRSIWKNEYLASNGIVSWDGVMENNLKAPIGIYFAIFESFNASSGENFSKRVAFTLAGKI